MVFAYNLISYLSLPWHILFKATCKNSKQHGPDNIFAQSGTFHQRREVSIIGEQAGPEDNLDLLLSEVIEYLSQYFLRVRNPRNIIFYTYIILVLC
jgi:hypothetical protein